MRKGEFYYFWDVKKSQLGRIHITECKEDTFLFTYNSGKGECAYSAVEGKLFINKWNVPEYCAIMGCQDNADEADDSLSSPGFDHLVGYEHSDSLGRGQTYYPSIYYYQGSDDRLSQGSVYDVEDLYDSYDD